MTSLAPNYGSGAIGTSISWPTRPVARRFQCHIVSWNIPRAHRLVSSVTSAGTQAPDIIAIIHVAQIIGYAQVMAVAHRCARFGSDKKEKRKLDRDAPRQWSSRSAPAAAIKFPAPLGGSLPPNAIIPKRKRLYGHGRTSLARLVPFYSRWPYYRLG